ncbi:hypothetical protein PHYSODRAFT_411482, partial [Phytophthora sojae]
DRAMFGSVWRVLSAGGWSSKCPTGRSLSDLYRYIPPGGDSNETEGIDYFLGERALLEHYRRTLVAEDGNTDGALSKRPDDEIDAVAMKEELIRRAHAAAEKVVDASVAFSPADEEWMPLSLYRDVGAAFLIGVVTRYSLVSEKNADNVSVP